MIKRALIYKKKISNSGQSMVEIIVALAIFAFIASALTGLILGSFTLLMRSQEFIKASSWAGEGVEALRAIRVQAWNEFDYSQSGIGISNNQWVFLGEGSQQNKDGFTRTIGFSPVYRDSNNVIVSASAPGAHEDVMTRIFDINVSWETSNGQTQDISREAIISNWNAINWQQIDWSGGNNQIIWEDEQKYFEDDGNIEIGISNQISLSLVSTSTYASEGYLISSAYNASGISGYSAIFWDEIIDPACNSCVVKLQIKTAPDNNGSPGPWSGIWFGPEGEDGDEGDYFTLANGELIHTDHNIDEWIKYKIIIIGDTMRTPIVDELKIYYQ